LREGDRVTGLVVDFEQWYQQAHRRLVSSLVAFCGDPDRGRDAADEAAARALERWHRVGALDWPDGWVLRTGFNLLRRQARRARLEHTLVRRTAPSPVLSGATGELWAVVADLSTRQRQAVVLRHVAQLTEPEIARVMGVARGTVSSTLRSAYHNLRQEIADQEAPANELPEGTIRHA
jgi:RNA polymerase sigma-70 factor, ECF subfamily